MQLIIFIAVGGAAGSVLRYLVSISMYAWLGHGFPYGTLTVNVLGALVMGFLTIFLVERFDGMDDILRSLLLIGFLGGFTTFSAFSVETLAQLENGDIHHAMLNMMLNVGLCLLAAWTGMSIARNL